MDSQSIISVFLGIGLAASVGFRVFLPLLVLSLASYFEVWELNTSWEWLGSEIALIILSVATMVEISAYFIPYLDNLLDSISVPLAAFAGVVIMLSVVSDLSPAITWALAIIAGAGTATTVSGSSSTTRLVSTGVTGGVTNPMVSLVETISAFVLSILSIFLPVIAFVLTMLILLIIYKFYRKFRSNKT
ncbi:DUF4126 domain-containing protein [Gaetbulibacter saemankumensis]|uniref:DUF4126 domain-containing protein n=1 Tax=Gaetbulibacter saemankumensis TaxID=311208 RepID=UPI0009FF2474|nr:DUF4126 domain-containing protein [Gaetbulibacter saemankumensis]